ncbi:MAG: hypothetical protein DMF86_16175 [Acidobacteria bacterium]|nr:MAG: hypothetical protein DMF86_16175 [Acidobacteriota bacterium]
MPRLALASAALAVAVAACGGRMPPGQPGDGQVISGNERFGWDQPAGDAAELATFRYAFYTDNARTGQAAAAGFACTCRLPSMSSGTHTLQIAAFIIDAGTVRESARSSSVTVNVR